MYVVVCTVADHGVTVPDSQKLSNIYGIRTKLGKFGECMHKLGYFVILHTNIISGIALHFLRNIKYHQEV